MKVWTSAMIKIYPAHQKQRRKVNKNVKSNRFHPWQRRQNLIGGKPCTKCVILKSRVKLCVFWLPQYFCYSIEAKRVESTRTGGDRSIKSMFTCVLTILLCFKESKEKKNEEKIF